MGSLRFSIQYNNPCDIDADVLLLLYPQRWSARVDRVVKSLVQRGMKPRGRFEPKPGSLAILEPTPGTSTPRVAVMGSTDMPSYPYVSLTGSVATAIEKLAVLGIPLGRVASLVEGGRDGMDAMAVCQYLMTGFRIASAGGPDQVLGDIVFVEENQRRFERLSLFLRGIDAAEGAVAGDSVTSSEELTGAEGHIFVALPFSDAFEDVYEFGIQPASQECGYVCEHAGREKYTGDILTHILRRIESARLVIADLSAARPNVYLEVGYAWGKGVPVLFVAHRDEVPHFDVQGHQCVRYRNITHLRAELEAFLSVI